ncbi:MAG TPA: DUF2007 domain-containing protein [Sphingobium sp.]
MSLVELARHSDAALAHIVKGRLEAGGIPAYCFDTGMNFAEGIPMLFQVRIMVLAEDLEAATALLAQQEVQEEAQGEGRGATADVIEEEVWKNENFDESGRSPARPRKRRLTMWIAVYIALFFILGLAVKHLLPPQQPPIEAEPFD